MKRYVLFIVFLVLDSIQLQAQNLDIEFIVFDGKDFNIKGRINYAVEDDLGRMWFASNGGGVLLFDGYDFQNVIHIPKDSSTLLSNHTISLFPLGDKMWVGNRFGFSVVDIFSLEVSNFQLGNHIDKPDEYKHYSESITSDSSFYWIGTYNQLVQTDKHFNFIKSFEITELKSPGGNETIIRLWQDKFHDDIIWIGTAYGLYTLNKSNGETNAHPCPLKNLVDFPEWKEYGIWDIIQPSDSILYMAAMHSGGLLEYNSKRKIWKQCLYKETTKDDPFIGNAGMAVISIADSTLLLNTNMGLALIRRGDTRYDFLPAYDFDKYGYARESYIDSHGYLWVTATSAIFKSKHPVSAKRPKQSSRVSTSLAGIELNNGKTNSLEKNHPIKATITLNNPGKANEVEYQYRLCDSEWQSLGTDRSVNLYNLDFGEHVFFSRSKEGSEDWKYGDSITIEIKTPFYLRPENLIVGVLILGFLLYLLWKIMKAIAVREEKLKHEFERKILESEMKALSSQMNPHFIFNSLNSIYNFILKNDTEQAADYLSKFSKLIRRVLQNSKEQSVILDEELQTLKLYLDLEMIRIEEKFDYNIQLESNVDTKKILIPAMLIQPHLENAIWHGIVPLVGSGHISIQIKIIENILVISIEDNGVGRGVVRKQQALKQKSLGSKITKDRLELLGSKGLIEGHQEYEDLFDAEGNPSGTKVTISIPFDYKL